jgi:hypothetical protein
VPGIYWQVAEGPITVISVCLPGMLNLGRHIVHNAISPLASAITSKVSLLRTNASRSRSDSPDTYRDLHSMETASKVSGDSELIRLEPERPKESYHWNASIGKGTTQTAEDFNGNRILVQKKVAVTSKPPGENTSMSL